MSAPPGPPLPAAASTRPSVLPLRARTGAVLLVVLLVTVVAFGWPFLLQPGSAQDDSHASDAPFLFVALLLLLAAVVLSEIAAGGLDSKAVALLGMLASIGGALRALSPGTAGLEPSFAVIILGGRVFGRGFGFVLGALTLFVGALVTGGVGPWLPFQMMSAGWVGFLAGSLPRAGGRLEVAMLASYAAAVGLGYGLLMNLWFWPFAGYAPEVSYAASAPAATNLEHYLRFYLTTSLAWDIGRSLVNAALLLLLGRPLLRALRRSSRRAAFGAVARFEP